MTGPQESAMPGPERERGIALLVVLWIIVAAALVVSAFNATVRSGATFVSSEVDLSKSEALLDAGLEVAAAHLIDEEEERRWKSDGRPYRIAFAGADLVISIKDARAYIDINKADKELLMGLLRQFAGSEVSARHVVDRILLAREPMGAQKKPQERQLVSDKPPAPDMPVFVDVAQLRGIDGMTSELYAAIAPHLTVYSVDGRINALVASNAVLASIPGLTLGDIERLKTSAKRSRQGGSGSANEPQMGGDHVSDVAGPAYLVTVSLMRRDGGRGASATYAIATDLDSQRPYRLVAKRAAGSG